MEYDFVCSGLEGPGVTVWDAGALVQLSSVDFHKLRNILEDFGQRSAVAQGLRAPITDIWRLRSSDQRLYLQTAQAPSGCCVLLGGLKVGRKKLFLHRVNGSIVEVEPLCVLDFYVHENHQRQGVGKALFEYMLEAEQQGPEQLGYDRPSGKLLSFVKKHYGLAHYVPQSNNFVVFEQFFDSTLGSPGRGGKASSSTNSSACWGPGALASLGHGRQTLHVIGSRAAAATGVELGAADPWVRSSQRPPTASLQHSIHLHTTTAGSTGGGSSSMSTGSAGGSSACSTSTTTSLGGAAAVPWSTLGGPGCPSAGVPTRKGDWDMPPSPTAAAAASQQQQQQQFLQQVHQAQDAPVYYGRGTGIKALMAGTPPADPNNYKGYQQALLAAAANPTPPRIKAGPLPQVGHAQQQSNWQQQQQVPQRFGSLGGSSGKERCRDTLDEFVDGTGGLSSNGRAEAALLTPTMNSSWHIGSNSSGSSHVIGGSNAATVTSATGTQQYALTRPFASPELAPGSLLPHDSMECERVSLRRQAMQLEQQRLQQQKPAWMAAGAGPPGHLLAAPVASYAVPTADMADVIGATLSSSTYQQQQQQQAGVGGWGATGGYNHGSRQYSRQSHAANSLCLSWDGLPQGLPASQQLVRADHGARQPGADGGSVYGDQSTRWGSSGLSESRVAAATHRSGSGAASCMRMT